MTDIPDTTDPPMADSPTPSPLASDSSTANSPMSDSPMERLLQEDACSFEFFQAVSLLQLLRLNERQPVGQFSNPEREAVHFGVTSSLSFPASQIQSIEHQEQGPPHMTVNFMGLTGPTGVLPYCYTELIQERLKAKDGTLEDFLNIFNHRIISFFYRAWEKYRFPASYSRGDNVFTHHLLDFIGLGTAGLQHRQSVPDDALIHFAALLGAQARSAEALEQILNGYFAVPVEVEQFAGAWYRLDASAQCRMTDDATDSQKVGAGVVVGDEIWDQQSRIRIRIGPLSMPQYNSFLPGGSACEPLKAMVRFFSNDELDFEVMLILNRDEVPRCEVGGENGSEPRLGWISWLKSVPLDHNPGDAILKL
ncbi:MAG: type VI secretion system baseplate subunit TssG [Candidatus Sulfotelmatobacter sp.]